MKPVKGYINLPFRHDGESDSAYLTISKGKIHATHEVNDNVLIDVTESGKIIGVEILHASQNMDLPEE